MMYVVILFKKNGVWTQEPVPKGTRFGPLVGKRIQVKIPHLRPNLWPVRSAVLLLIVERVAVFYDSIPCVLKYCKTILLCRINASY